MDLWFLVEDQELREQGEAFMKIIGCDFHPAWQQVAVFDDETAEIAALPGDTYFLFAQDVTY